MSPLEGLWATETANGGDCWAIFAYFFVFCPLSWPYLQARHYGTPVSPIMGCPPGHGPARDYRVWEPETSPRARARGSLLRNGHGDLPPAGGTRRSDVFPTFFMIFGRFLTSGVYYYGANTFLGVYYSWGVLPVKSKSKQKRNQGTCARGSKRPCVGRFPCCVFIFVSVIIYV